MDDMHPFEQQVAAEVAREMRPSRPVDAVAVIAAVDAVRSPKWRFQSMFSATKFVVAGAIVALFGGFLLSGVLTQPPSQEPLPPAAASALATAQAEPTDAATTEPEPSMEVEADDSTTTPDLLPGVDLVTEEVEPGVYRVVGDGIRDVELSTTTRPTLIAGLDGSVLIAENGGKRPNDRGCYGKCTAYRLGSPEVIRWSKKALGPAGREDAEGWDLAPTAIGPDGTIYARVWRPGNGSADLRSWDGRDWVIHRKRNQNGGVEWAGLDERGDLWAAWGANSGDGLRVGRLTADGWSPVVRATSSFALVSGSGTYRGGAPGPIALVTDGEVAAVGPTGLGEPMTLAGSVAELRGQSWGHAALTGDGTLWLVNGSTRELSRVTASTANTFDIEH